LFPLQREAVARRDKLVDEAGDISGYYRERIVCS
jgi:hypothetical protein